MLKLDETAFEGSVVVDSTSPEQARVQIAHYITDHTIKMHSENCRLHAVLKQARFNDLTFSVVEYGCEVTIEPKPLQDFYLLHINLSGECELFHEKRKLTMDKRHAVVCSPERHYQFQWHADSRALAIQIPRERILAHAREVMGQHVGDNIELDLSIDLDTPQGEALLGLVQYLISDSELEQGIAKQPASRYLEAALIDTLFRMQPGNYRESLSGREGACKILPFHVRKAERYMADNIDRPVKLTELAEVTGVSTRTLSSNFNHFLGDSPARYFLNMRLDRARSMLLDSRADKKVSDVAFELGFSHHSGFAAAYKSRFHETPTETLFRQRQDLTD